MAGTGDDTIGQAVLKGIRKGHDKVHVIKSIKLELRKGVVLVFVSPSGCGKSTTLRRIAGLKSISGGELRIDGKRTHGLRPSHRGAAMVLQRYALCPHMRVAENMGFSLKVSGVGAAQRGEQAQRTAEFLRITALLGCDPNARSGVQRQRLAIGDWRLAIGDWPRHRAPAQSAFV